MNVKSHIQVFTVMEFPISFFLTGYVKLFCNFVNLCQSKLVEADVRRQVEKPDDGRRKGQRQRQRVRVLAPGQSCLNQAQRRFDT